MLSCKKQCLRSLDVTVLSVSAGACEHPVGKRDALIDGSTARTHPRRWEEPVYDKDIRIGLQLALQRTKRAVLHLPAEEPLVPSRDVLILDDDEPPPFCDVMVCLVGLCPPPVGEPLVLPPDEMSRVIPAPGSLHLAGKLLLQALEAFRFSDCYVVLLPFGGRYRRLDAEVEADWGLMLLDGIVSAFRNIAGQHQIYP